MPGVIFFAQYCDTRLSFSLRGAEELISYGNFVSSTAYEVRRLNPGSACHLIPSNAFHPSSKPPCFRIGLYGLWRARTPNKWNALVQARGASRASDSSHVLVACAASCYAIMRSPHYSPEAPSCNANWRAGNAPFGRSRCVVGKSMLVAIHRNHFRVVLNSLHGVHVRQATHPSHVAVFRSAQQLISAFTPFFPKSTRMHKRTIYIVHLIRADGVECVCFARDHVSLETAPTLFCVEQLHF